jgi:hypothetical protein
VYIGTLAILVALGGAQSARATLLAYDPFSGAEGANINGSGTGFGFGSSTWAPSGTSGGVATYTGFSLGYADSFGNVLQTSGNAGFFQGLTTANTSMVLNRYLSFTNGLADGTTWISMLLVRQGPTGSNPNNPYARGVNVTFDYPDSNGGGNQRVGVGNASNAATNTLGILSAGGQLRPSANPAYQFGGVGQLLTNLVILRIDHVAGTNNSDNAYLWVNPTDLTAVPNISAATTNVSGLFDYTLSVVRVFVGGNSNAAQRYGELVIDELRIGETYADVTPIIPEPAAALLGGFGALAFLMYRRRK